MSSKRGMNKTSKEKLTPDNRMGWIRNLQALNESEEDSTWHEYEIASECYITGELNYNNGKIFCRLLTLKKDRFGLYKYLLRIQSPKNNLTLAEAKSKKGYYFLDGDSGELISLFSFFFQCRFYKSATYTFLSEHEKIKTEHDFLYQQCAPRIHPTIFNNQLRNFSIGLREFLDKVKTLNIEKHQSFILACWHYARSLREIGIDSEMVFMRLVSAVEALSANYTLAQKENSLDKADFKMLFESENSSLSAIQTKDLKEILKVNKKGEIKIDKSSLKFKNFVIIHSKGFQFTQKKEESDHLYVTPSTLKKTLDNIYSARSKYLHEGEPMYLSCFMNIDTCWDFDCSLGATIDNRKFSSPQKLPYTYWFENLVRYCLLDYIKEQTL